MVSARHSCGPADAERRASRPASIVKSPGASFTVPHCFQANQIGHEDASGNNRDVHQLAVRIFSVEYSKDQQLAGVYLVEHAPAPSA